MRNAVVQMQVVWPRDVYAAFWTECLDCASEGAEMKETSLSPKWQVEQ